LSHCLLNSVSFFSLSLNIFLFWVLSLFSLSYILPHLGPLFLMSSLTLFVTTVLSFFSSYCVVCQSSICLSFIVVLVFLLISFFVVLYVLLFFVSLLLCLFFSNHCLVFVLSSLFCVSWICPSCLVILIFLLVSIFVVLHVSLFFSSLLLCFL